MSMTNVKAMFMRFPKFPGYATLPGTYLSRTARYLRVPINVSPNPLVAYLTYCSRRPAIIMPCLLACLPCHAMPCGGCHPLPRSARQEPTRSPESAVPPESHSHSSPTVFCAVQYDSVETHPAYHQQERRKTASAIISSRMTLISYRCPTSEDWDPDVCTSGG
jgi:hypothetical protein